MTPEDVYLVRLFVARNQKVISYYLGSHGKRTRFLASAMTFPTKSSAVSAMQRLDLPMTSTIVSVQSVIAEGESDSASLDLTLMEVSIRHLQSLKDPLKDLPVKDLPDGIIEREIEDLRTGNKFLITNSALCKSP